RAARRSENDGLDSRGLGGVTQETRAFDVNVVHLARVLALTRDSSCEMIDLADTFDRAFVVVSVCDRAGESLDAKIDEPIRNGGGHHANVFGAFGGELTNEMRAEETGTAGDERDCSLTFLDRRPPLAGGGWSHACSALTREL